MRRVGNGNLDGTSQDAGVLYQANRYHLHAVLLFFWATLLALLWSMSGDLVRRPARGRDAVIIRHGEGAGVAGQRLLQRSIATENVVTECWEQFRRSSPQDAQAIAADPRWGPRLRAALMHAPLAGYKELRQLVTERHAFVKGRVQADREVANRSPASPKTTPGEEPIA